MIDRVSVQEENFDEALRSAFQVWTPYEIRKSHSF